ncbi:MAG TPA: penicillin acylase family protein, partial [Gemmatales bacterium]|nr:penicillin acylase family protein [Gemmatales bacterium]
SMMQQMEGPLWTLLDQQPEHLLPPRYPTWRDLCIDAVDRTIIVMQSTGTPLEEQHWGTVNAPRVGHPLSAAVPFSARLLNLPETPLPGSRRDLPRISSTGHGASERFAVSPGREEQGIFHMPGGQSGHPLSPHYQDGHAAWEQGLPTPFLPGPKVSEMIFEKIQ